MLVNDFGAIAEAIPHLTARIARSPAAAARARGRRMPVAVLGPGTGLGTAIGAPVAGGWAAISGDGGHADLAPVDDEELEIWQRLRRAHGRVSAETVLCGPGLERLYAAVAGGAALGAAEIDAAAWRGEPDGASHARALHALARPRRRQPRAGRGRARRRVPRRRHPAALGRTFRRRGLPARLRGQGAVHRLACARIPSFVVMHPQPGLVGLAALAEAAA